MTATVRRERERPTIEHDRIEGAAVIRPIGRLDADLVADVRQMILDARVPVVVDLTASVFVDPAALRRVATGWDMFRPRMSLVCHQRTGRQLLARAGVHEHVSIFPEVDDALVALASSTKDVDGWSPSTSTSRGPKGRSGDNAT